MRLVLCLILTVLSLPAVAGEPVSRDAVEQALREYVYAKYRGDADAVRARAHHDIARAVRMDSYWGHPSDEWVRRFNHDQLQFYGTPYNTTRFEDPSDGRLQIEVFDLARFSASAVVVMEDVVDYVHLALFEGRWLIVDSAVIILEEDGAPVPRVDLSDAAAVEAVIRGYALGFYEVDGNKVQATCHPSLSKRTMERRPDADFDYLSLITFEEIRLLGEAFNRDQRFDPTVARARVEVYQIRGNVAAARLTGSVWFDYFHLMKVNGDWKIVNIMYESLPEDQREAPTGG